MLARKAADCFCVRVRLGDEKSTCVTPNLMEYPSALRRYGWLGGFVLMFRD